MQTKRILISVLSIMLILSGCSFFQKENKNIPETTSGITIPSHFVEDITEEEIDNIKLEYSILFPVTYTIGMIPGETRTEAIKIKNTGLKADTFVFEGEVRRGEENWIDFSTLPEPTYLKSGKEMKLIFTVTVPEDAEIGSGLGTSVFASRESNKQIVGSTDFYVKVIEKKSSK